MNFGTIGIILICVAVGYVLFPLVEKSILPDDEGAATSELVDDSAAPAKPRQTITLTGDDEVVVTPAKTVAVAGSDLGIDLSKFAKEDYPDRVALSEEISIVVRDKPYPLTAGSMVDVIGLEGEDVIFSVMGVVEGAIDIRKTNFIELAMPKMLERMANPNAQPPAVAPPVVPDPAPAPASAPAQPAATPTPGLSESQPVIPVEPAQPAVSDQPAAPASAGSGELTDTEILTIMRASIEASEVTEFTLDQVQDARAGTPEVYEGVQRDTGIIVFRTETIVGPQDIEAMAIIADGKVLQWLYAKNKQQMK
ncbi:hypothetical protein [Persicirhabdus sediminis]|uniref:Uncharacterized protein n=1 Tax=Persicirhabdus sediminis TaxID=454144 RepID=A0A8J7SLF1_9BACT|nr:hypothetical protein [Persicirhabdus sediminis]MBK1790353.1 hypothetical protein [Persicirhabdus sediminis]